MAATGLIIVLVLIVTGILIWGALTDWKFKTPKKGDKCTPDSGNEIDNVNSYKINSESDCVPSECISGYDLTDEGICKEVVVNPLENLTKVGTFNSGTLWPERGNMFKLDVNEYIEATPDDSITDDKNIVGMYLLKDKWVVYRRNNDSSLFENIWEKQNEHQDTGHDWSLKIYRDTGRMRLDGAPSPGNPGGEFNASQWEQTQTGVEPFRIDTDNNCPYINLRDKDGQKKHFIPDSIKSSYCS